MKKMLCSGLVLMFAMFLSVSASEARERKVLIDEHWQEDVAALVLRDRNHPSIFCWSIGNEVIERKDIQVITTARKPARTRISVTF